MHRRPAPKRVWGADRGTQSDPPTNAPLPNAADQDRDFLGFSVNLGPTWNYLHRRRNLAVEYMDHYMTPPELLYPVSRVGSRLLPELIPADARRLIAEYTRPSLWSGLVPEDRDQFRQLTTPYPNPFGPGTIARLRMTEFDAQGNGRVACPVCGRMYPLDEFIQTNASGWIYVEPNWRDPVANPDSHQGRQLIEAETQRRRQMWVRWLRDGNLPDGAPGILVCSLACKNDWWNHKRVQHNRRRLRSGQTITWANDPGVDIDYPALTTLPANRLKLYDPAWPPTTPVDYFGSPELLPRPIDEVPTKSQWKRPRITVDKEI